MTTLLTLDLVPGDILMDLGTGVRLIYKDFGSTQGDDHLDSYGW